jgi:hypothetical protein
MKNKFIIKGSALLFCAALVVNCGSNDLDVDVETPENDITTTETTENIQPSGIEYSVPTPNELFGIVKEEGGELHIDLINSLDNEESYIDLKSKALNFGVYSADLGYMSCFDHSLEFLKYTKSVERLGEELGISEVFDKDLMDRIENNEGNNDSLFIISNDTYYDSYQFLEENEKGMELALIISGGFIESLYIVSNLVDGYEDSNAIVKKIGDQKLVLENILDFCTTYMDEPNVSEIMDDLFTLSETFESNMEFVETESNISNQDGVATVSGGGHLVMNEKAFLAVKEKVAELRNKITQK